MKLTLYLVLRFKGVTKDELFLFIRIVILEVHVPTGIFWYTQITNENRNVLSTENTIRPESCLLVNVVAYCHLMFLGFEWSLLPKMAIGLLAGCCSWCCLRGVCYDVLFQGNLTNFGFISPTEGVWYNISTPLWGVHNSMIKLRIWWKMRKLKNFGAQKHFVVGQLTSGAVLFVGEFIATDSFVWWIYHTNGV